VNFLAVYRIATHKNFGADLQKQAQDSLLTHANKLVALADTSAYQLPIQMGDFVWGSNSAVANNGIGLLHAYYLTGNVKYKNAAQRALDYLLGANPMDISYVTGYGARSPMHPHHRPSDGDDVAEPVPGQLVGGPHDGGQDAHTPGCREYLQKGKPALSYVDNACSYATNEVAINWNAPFAYLVGALHFLNLGEKAPQF
jgi:endoglucanase